MPLHVSDAANRLDLRNLGSKLRVVLILALFKQVLIASVAWILIAHPAGTAGGQRGTTDERQLDEKLDSGNRHVTAMRSITQHLLGGWTYVPL